MKIVVTGALGHIGSLLIRQLGNQFKDLHVTMIDSMMTQRYPSLFNLPDNARFHFIEHHIKDDGVAAFIKGADVVIHLAAITDAAGTASKPEVVHNNNFNSTKAVAEACHGLNIPIIFPSSTSVYGSQSTLVDETCQELKPQSPYAESKISEESLIVDLSQKGLKGVVCRFGTIYGASVGMRFHTAVNKFCWQAVMKQPVTAWRTALHQKRPYLYLQDGINAFIHIIRNHLYGGEVFNILSGNHTVAEVIDTIKATIPTLEVELVDHQIMNQLSYEVSVDKFTKTGFQFKGHLGTGIAETLQLLKNAN